MTPLVFLHGFTGSPACFAEVVRLLRSTPAGEQEVFAPELLGHGAASELWAESFEDEVTRLARAVAAAFSERAHLVGYSLGGRLALGLLLEHRELFRSATLVGVHPGLGDSRERSERAESDARWAELLERRGCEAFAERWEAQPLFATQRSLSAPVRDVRATVRRSHAAHGLARAVRVLGLGRMPFFQPRLGDIGVPVQLVVGGVDRKFLAIAGDMLPRLPDATLHVVPNVGHDVVLEAPAALADLIRKGTGDERARVAADRRI